MRRVTEMTDGTSASADDGAGASASASASADADVGSCATVDATRVARLKHPRAIRWLHWINFPLLFVMIWSGLRIYWAEDIYAFGIGSWQWFAFFPEAIYENLDLERRLARGMAFHFTFGWLFVINGLIYAIYLAASGEWRHIIPDRRTPREAKDVLLHDLHMKKETPPQGLYNAAQRMAYTIVLLMAAIIVISGFAIYKPTQLYPLPLLFGGYQGARLIHFSMTIGLLLFFLVHVVQVIRAGWNNFRAMVTGYEIETPQPEPEPEPERELGRPGHGPGTDDGLAEPVEPAEVSR